MEPDIPTTPELLEHWREATRAADLAERLAMVAEDSADRAEKNAAAAEEIASLAERAARSAERAAAVARRAADRATEFAKESRAGSVMSARQTAVDARVEEDAARDRYHEAERDDRERRAR